MATRATVSVVGEHHLRSSQSRVLAHPEMVEVRGGRPTHLSLECTGVPRVRGRGSSGDSEVGEGCRMSVGRGHHQVGRQKWALERPQVRQGTRCALFVMSFVENMTVYQYTGFFSPEPCAPPTSPHCRLDLAALIIAFFPVGLVCRE